MRACGRQTSSRAFTHRGCRCGDGRPDVSTKLTADMIKLVSFPEENLPEGYLSTTERLHGRILLPVSRPTNPS